jgi:large subunit ribosomal protein L2
MALKTYRPTTKSSRQMSRVNYRTLLSGHKPHKALKSGGKRDVGRNSQGRITMRHRGGGHKQLYRAVDFKFDKKDIPAKIASIEYDPNRSAFIGIAVYRDGEKRYIVLPKTAKVGDEFIVSAKAPAKAGNRLPLGEMPVGVFIYNIEIKPGAGGVLVRSAGNFAEVVAQDSGYTHIKLPSTEIRKVIGTCWATVGEVSNDEHRLENWGKAGRSRWKGIRPRVRGSVMNPVDHPYGGGEGKQGRGRRRLVTLWGKPAGKGQKTRRPKKYSNVFILSRRKVGKRK